jgi:transcriptional regulator with XRE-family HTH domain
MEEVIATETLRPILAANIKRVRAARGLTQQQLADRIGISYVFLNRIENEKSSPSAEVLFSLADALQVSADSLRQLSSPAPVDAA